MRKGAIKKACTTTTVSLSKAEFMVWSDRELEKKFIDRQRDAIVWIELVDHLQLLRWTGRRMSI